MAICRTQSSDAVVNFLRNKGLAEYAVFGLLGNIYAESGVISSNLQNTYNTKWNVTDTQYVKAVDDGTWRTPEGKTFQTDGGGFGLCQWTSAGRKTGLYNYARANNKSIADINMQLGWLWEELNSSGYRTCMAALKKATSIRTCSDAVVKYYERPKNQSESNLEKRASYGTQFYELYHQEQKKEDGILMTDKEFIAKLRDIADNYKTYYVYGTWGWPANDKNKSRAINARPENRADQNRINALSPDTFIFDCSGLIKGPLWGWCGDPTKAYGGAGYACNGVPDSGDLIKYCTDVSTDFSNIASCELVYMPGHVGVCIDGNTGLVVECTTAWDHKVLYSYIQEKNPTASRKRKWQKHGKMSKWIQYTGQVDPAPAPIPTPQPTPTPPECGIITYTVQKGDTLTKIANKYNSTVDDILKLNPQITNPNVISVGQKIEVPVDSKNLHTGSNTAAPAPTPKPTTITYTVKKGDTLSKIAKATNADGGWRAIAKSNNIKFPYIIRAGQVLKIKTK